MGGKNQSRRIKNNAQPSSSSRSAELLSSSELQGSSGMLTALLPTLGGVSGDHKLTIEFLLCSKKLSKKDPLTRTKALYELTELVKVCKSEDVMEALPWWTHTYKILSFNRERKIREYTQLAHCGIVKASGRQLAPHLKQLMPPWLFALHDDHAPTRTRANVSIMTAFPTGKLPEALAFCGKEIVQILHETLVGNSYKALDRIETVEERELEITRLVANCLKVLQYFVESLPPEKQDWLWTELTPLLQATAFWKLAVHNDSRVRAAWYTAVGSLFARFGALFGEQYGLKTTRVLLSARDHNSPMDNSTEELWDCLLQIVNASKDWHEWVHQKDLLIKRIIDIIENGGWGSARRLTEILLSLLAHLPADLHTKDLYDRFFCGLFKGLEQKSVMSSKSERMAWLTCLAQCLRLVSQRGDDFITSLTNVFFHTWLNIVLSYDEDEATRNNLVKHSAITMGNLVIYWLELTKEDNGEKYDQLVRIFWHNMGSTIVAQINQLTDEPDQISRLIDLHTLMLQTLTTALWQDGRKHSITFNRELQPSTEECSGTRPSQYCVETRKRYNHNLGEVVEITCAHYLGFAYDYLKCSEVINPLNTLLVEFDNQSLFLALARRFDTDSVYELYDKVLRVWLLGDTMKCDAVVGLVHLSLKHLNEAEQLAVFESFEQFPPCTLEWCMSMALKYPRAAESATRRFMQSPAVQAALWTVCRRAADENDAFATSLVCLCTQPDDMGNLLVSRAGVTQMLRAVGESLRAAPDDTLQRVSDLAALLAPALLRHSEPDSSAKFLLDMFYVLLRAPLGDPRLEVPMWHKLCEACRDGLWVLTNEHRTQCAESYLQAVHDSLLQDMSKLDISKVDSITRLYQCLLTDADEDPKLTRRIFRFPPLDGLARLEAHALRHACLVGQLSCPFEENATIVTLIEESSDTNVEELTKELFLQYAYRCLFRAFFFVRIRGHHEEDDESLDNVARREPTGHQLIARNILLSDAFFVEEFTILMYEYSVICALHAGYEFWPHYELLTQTKLKVESILGDIISESNTNVCLKVYSCLKEKSFSHGYFWSVALRRYQFMTEYKEVSSCDREEIESFTSASGYVHTFQTNKTLYSHDTESALRVHYILMLRAWHAAHASDPGVVDNQFLRDAFAIGEEYSPDFIITAYYRHKHTMLYKTDISNASWRQVISNAAVVDFFSEFVKIHGWDASDFQWNFVNFMLCYLLNSINKSKLRWDCTKVALLTRSVLRLYTTVQMFVGGVAKESERRTPSAHVAALPGEWKDIFEPDMLRDILSLIQQVLEPQRIGPMTAVQALVVTELIDVVRGMDWQRLAPEATNGDCALQRLTPLAAAALCRTQHFRYKVLAHSLLKILAKPLVLEDAKKLAEWSQNNNEDGKKNKAPPSFALTYFEPSLVALQDACLAMLAPFTSGEQSCDLEPFSEQESLALGWLLLADALFEAAHKQSSDLHLHYVAIFRERKYAEALVEGTLRLMPAKVLEHARVAEPASDLTLLFTTPPSFETHLLCSPEDVAALACRCFFLAVSEWGQVAVRMWWGASAVKLARTVNQLVRSFVAPVLIDRQLKAVVELVPDNEDTTVSVRWSTFEAECVYKVDDKKLRLEVSMNPDYPLSPPTIASPAATSSKAVPVSNKHWLAFYLAYQNGSVANAMKIWMEAVSARMESARTCYICYSRLHTTTGRLPTVPCHLCKNRFHRDCIGMWFTTSKKSQCPVCRSVF